MTLNRQPHLGPLRSRVRSLFLCLWLYLFFIESLPAIICRCCPHSDYCYANVYAFKGGRLFGREYGVDVLYSLSHPPCPHPRKRSYARLPLLLCRNYAAQNKPTLYEPAHGHFNTFDITIFKNIYKEQIEGCLNFRNTGQQPDTPNTLQDTKRGAWRERDVWLDGRG